LLFFFTKKEKQQTTVAMQLNRNTKAWFKNYFPNFCFSAANASFMGKSFISFFRPGGVFALLLFN
jgi:hypothetical protein